MPWSAVVDTCVATNNTEDTPAACVCRQPTTAEAPSPSVGDVVNTECHDCGQYGYYSTVSEGTATNSCCALSGTVYETP
jgi:hypothetical protein